jgi:hypothetical protein
MTTRRKDREAELARLLVENPAEFAAQYRQFAGISAAAPLPIGKPAVEMIREMLDAEFQGTQGENGD